MVKEAHKRMDMYDLGEELALMNIITKSEKEKPHHIITYIGIEGNGFVCIGNAEELNAPGEARDTR